MPHSAPTSCRATRPPICTRTHAARPTSAPAWELAGISHAACRSTIVGAAHDCVWVRARHALPARCSLVGPSCAPHGVWMRVFVRQVRNSSHIHAVLPCAGVCCGHTPRAESPGAHMLGSRHTLMGGARNIGRACWPLVSNAPRSTSVLPKRARSRSHAWCFCCAAVPV